MAAIGWITVAAFGCMCALSAIIAIMENNAKKKVADSEWEEYADYNDVDAVRMKSLLADNADNQSDEATAVKSKKAGDAK